MYIIATVPRAVGEYRRYLSIQTMLCSPFMVSTGVRTRYENNTSTDPARTLFPLFTYRLSLHQSELCQHTLKQDRHIHRERCRLTTYALLLTKNAWNLYRVPEWIDLTSRNPARESQPVDAVCKAQTGKGYI